MTETILDAEAGLVQCAHRKAAIIGAGSYRTHAPWDDESWCFWALNEIPQPRTDRHFELHPMAVQSRIDLLALRDCAVPCYVLDVGELTPERTSGFAAGEGPYFIPYPVHYPLERVLEKTGGRRYFTCTFAYQVALAIAEGFEEIGLWGVDLDLGTMRERLVEKPCLEYWLGQAEGRGMRITLALGGTLLQRPWLYGYDYDDEKAGVERVCDEAVLATSPKRWSGILHRLSHLHGGPHATALATVSRLLARE